MVADRKRKRAQGGSNAETKRRHVSPDEDEDEEQYIKDGDVVSDAEGKPDAQLSDVDVEEGDASEQDEEEEEDEDEEWTGLAAGSAAKDDHSRPSGKPRKPPTGEELRNIKDASELYRSSSFKLQIDALLPNVRPKYQRSAPLDRFLLALHTFLKDLPSKPPKHPLVASRELLKKDIAVPYINPQPTEDTNWKVAFEPPTELTLVGAWPTKLSVKAKDKRPYSVDLAVEMPSSLFQEKDYLNSRFFQKRAYYLGVIAAAVTGKKSKLDVTAHYESASGDPRLTTLVLRSKTEDSANSFSKVHAQVRIIPTLASDSPIPLQRLSPRRSNIRIATSEEGPADIPTPLYNTALLLSTTPRAHLLRVYHLKQDVPAFADALTLLKVWANQRGYGEGERLSVRGFEGKGIFWAAVLDYLCSGEEPGGAFGGSGSRRKPLGRGLSSYQLFRAALDFFARHNFQEGPVFMKTTSGHRFSTEEYGVHEAVFVDSTSSVNLLAGVPLSSLEMLRHDAKETLETLGSSLLSSNSSQDPFQQVFLKDMRDLQTRFDVVMRVDLSSAKPPRLPSHSALDHGSPYNALMSTLISTLRTGFGNRAKAIAVLQPSSGARPLSQAHPSNNPVVYIGLVLDTDQAFRLVDHGPAADNPDPDAAKAFRELWGDKAELRRFKDGSIVESVVWDVKTADERAHIPFSIARHLLVRHCGIEADSVTSWQASYDALLRLPETITTYYQAAGAATGFKAAMAAFDSLVKSIKALDDELPLAILNVSAVSESLRYTNVFSPVALPAKLASVLPACARYLPVMDIIVEFEKSGRWPDDLRAIQKIKLAFFETLGSALMSSVEGLQATVVLGDGVTTSDIQDVASLEIVTPEGWAFSARIWHDREETLLDRLIDDKPHIPKHIKRKMREMQSKEEASKEAKERMAALEAKEVYTRRFVHGPRHHRAIAALAHRYTAFAGTVRLVKRWLAAHWLLGGHVREEAVELLCAHVFLCGAASTSSEVAREGVPATRERGFALVVQFLKEWEWANGLLVPVHGSEPRAEGAPAASSIPNHASPRSGVWHIQTEFDEEGFMWTGAGPDAIVARRVRALAKAAWVCLRSVETNSFEVKTLFTHPTEDYDFVIQLDPSILPRYYQNIVADVSVWKAGKYSNAAILGSKENQGPFLPGFDPARLLFSDLQRVYKDTFKIFWDPLGGDRFGAVWDPTLKEPRPFRVLGGYSSIPITKGQKEKSKDKTLVLLNSAAVLSEVERLGTDLISGMIEQA